MRLFTFTLVVIKFCTTPYLSFASHPADSTKMTMENVAVLEVALEALLHDQDYELANRLVTHHLDGSVKTSHYLYLSALSYLQIKADDEALDVLLLAHKLYPSEPVFVYELSLFHARRQQCAKALVYWQRYKSLIGEVLAEHRQNPIYDHCPETWVSQGGMMAAFESEHAANQQKSVDYIKAHEGSYLSQICTAITGLCPANHQFAVTHNQRPQSNFRIGLHYSTRRLLTMRDEMRLDYQQTHYLQTPRSQSAALSARLQRFQNLLKSYSIRLGVAHDFTPSYKGSQLSRDENFSFELGRHTKLSPKTIQTLTFSVVTGRNQQAGYKGYGVGLGYRWSVHDNVIIGGNIAASQFRPSHNDALGPYSRVSYKLSSKLRLSSDFLLGLNLSRADAHYQKTLPYLAVPHQLTDRRKEIEFIYTGDNFGTFHPYIGLRFAHSKSENTLQTGKSRVINFGLNARF